MDEPNTAQDETAEEHEDEEHEAAHENGENGAGRRTQMWLAIAKVAVPVGWIAVEVLHRFTHAG